jgi:hypothetical protein
MTPPLWVMRLLPALSGWGGTAFGLSIFASAEAGATGVAATVALAGAGGGNGVLGRARGSGTRTKGSSGAGEFSPVIAGRSPLNSGRSRSGVGNRSSCEKAGATAVPASTSAAKTVLTPNLVTLRHSPRNEP